MEKLTIKIDGKEHTALIPKARLWREIIKFEEERKNLDDLDYIDRHAEIIASAFDKEVTAQKVMDNLYIDEILPLYYKLYNWIIFLITSKLSLPPNAATPAEQD